MARRDDVFATVTTEGGLLPADLLGRIAQSDTALKGLKLADYHLNANERLGEMINRSWNRAMGAWAAFQESLARLAPDDNATTVTRERWLLVLFEELGFGRLQPSRAIDLGGRQFPVSHEWGGNVPLHLVGARVDLDRRTAGVVGAARSSPHSLIQELLNSSPSHLWGIVSNGTELRLLRDNSSVTRQAYVSFDLAAMMEGQVYSDFVLLWLLLHESRFEGEEPTTCWLETWAKEGEAQGSRALEELRAGVEVAIMAFGQGFLAHASNRSLRDRLRNGELDAQDYYRQLLRLVYRQLFLLVAEDRDLLIVPDATPADRERYISFYSMNRLRRLAERRRGTLHADLYQSLKIVMRALDESGSDPLGLPALGSYLWRPAAIPDLGDAEISNRDLLAGISALAFHLEDRKARPTDFRNLGSEELGSVYESLLELHPIVNVDAGSFALETAAGHERKSTGSYYTPTSLITSLLDTALTPVLDEAAKEPDTEGAILALRIVDPACGSGHFLVAASHRLAKRLATARTGDDEPAPSAVKTALRDVIGHCVYGVDVNPMAVELCKVSLWMEALEPGRPLSFLDHHIICGNSLIGATAETVQSGVPEEAFRWMAGDDRKYVTTLKRRNREESGGEDWLPLDGSRNGGIVHIADGIAELEMLADESIAGIRQKELRYSKLQESEAMSRARFAADAWCAAFVARKDPAEPVITTSVVRGISSDGPGLDPRLRPFVSELAEEFEFLHWHLAFPDVFAPVSPTPPGIARQAGFDVVLGNPPWDQLQLDDVEYFAATHPEIANEPNMSQRKKAIERLEAEDPSAHASYVAAVRRMEGLQHFIHASGRFPLSSIGRLNSAPLFVESAMTVMHPEGRIGMVTPTGIATDSFTRFLFANLVQTNRLASLFDFENKQPLFAGVHRQFKFCLLTIAGMEGRLSATQFVFFATDPGQIDEPDRRFELSSEDFALLNPNTLTCPVFRNSADADLIRSIYRRVPVLSLDGPPAASPWGFSGMLMFMMNTDSHLLRTRAMLESESWQLEDSSFVRDDQRYLPLYEGKMFHNFDHRWASHGGGSEIVELTEADKQDPRQLALPRYWVPEGDVASKLSGRPRGWLLAWRDISNSTNERSLVTTALPYAAAANNAPLAFVAPQFEALKPYLMACMSSFVLDFCARSKMGGSHLNFYVVRQLPVLGPETFLGSAPWDKTTSVAEWLRPRISELVFTAWDMLDFARELGCEGGPYGWDTARRQLLRAEVDACFFHLYGLAPNDAEYVMDSFPVLARREKVEFGEYRTKRLTMDCLHALEAARSEVASGAAGAIGGAVELTPPAN